MKKRYVILTICLIVLGLSVVGLFHARRRFVGLPGSSTTEGSRAVTDGGVKVVGWQGMIDAAEQKAGMTIYDARLVQEGDLLHITTGPAVTYWKSNAIASGDFTVGATFNEPRFMHLNTHAHPYGVFIGGNEMGTPNQSDLYCAAYGNGKFIVRGMGPKPFRLNGFFGESNDAVHKASGRGQPVTQEIKLSVRGNTVTCSINGSNVVSYDKAELTGAGKLRSTDGHYGIRFAHNTDVLVSGLTLSK